jgi:uncharacterized protein (TIGR02145 family)
MKTKIILIMSIGLLTGIVLVYQACKKEEANQNPSCDITSPAEGAVFTRGETVNISVNATDTDGSITKVTFYVDGTEKSSSSSSPYKWDWDTSGETDGSHTLKATSTDNDGASASDEVTITIHVEVAPEAAFRAFPTCGVAPCSVDFTDLSTNDPAGWQWDFGDGSTSTNKNPSHTYDSDGSYAVTLTVTNNSGSDTESRTGYINISANGCFGGFQDPRDDQEYTTVTIGEQTWFAENLNYETGNSWCYDDNPNNCEAFGRLYDWETAMLACPTGWHLASDEEWKILEGTADSQYPVGDMEWDAIGDRGADAGENLKLSGTDLYGFSADLGGNSWNFGASFNFLGSWGSWWTSTEYGTNNAWGRSLGASTPQVHRDHSPKAEFLFSVRCIRD